MQSQFFLSTAQPSALFASMQAMAAYEVRGQLIDEGSVPQLLEFLIKKGTGANVLPRMLEYLK